VLDLIPYERRPGALVRFSTPRMGVCSNPMLELSSTEMHDVPVGVRLRDFVIEARGPVTCLKNGEWLLRDHWDEKTAPGDVIVWCVFPQGRETVRLLLQVATVLSLFIAPAATPYLTGVSLAFNLLAPPRQPNINNEAPGSIYSAALAGNAARLDQPIWKNCGHVKITPPFAAIPYFVNLPRADAADPLLDTEQYGYFLYCVGIGDHAVVRTLIGKTPVSSYQDVIVAQYLAPGEQPSTVEANVLTSSEVANLELATDINGDGIYVGGYVACRPQDRVTKIGIDVEAPQGLGHITSGGSDDLVVAWEVQVREIDDFGVPVGEWTPVGNESREYDTNSLQRWSNEYTLSAPIRAEVRLYRTNPKNKDSDARDQINWAGLRATLEAPATLNPNAAHYELVIRAGKQLTAESQRDFSMLVNGKCPIWDPDTETWSANVVHRNPAWWLVDLWRNEAWGRGYPDREIDLVGMAALAATCDERQDHFDFSFSTSIDLAEAEQLIARACRSRASQPLGLHTATRDELVTDHFTMFSARNTQPESIVQTEDLPSRDRPDAIIVTYQDHIRWDLKEIICWVPGADVPSDGDPANPLFIHLDGVIGAKQAEREGLAMAAKVAYRGLKFGLTTEMEGFLLRHMDTVRVQPDLPEYGASGDVTYWDPATLAMELSEPADFSEAPIYITLRRDDGSITAPVEVTAGVNPTTVYLPAAPDFDIIFDDGGRERPVYFLGPLSSDELCKVEEIADGGTTDEGAQLFDVRLVIDDPRVHAADNALLPTLGEIQDPIDDGTDIPSEGGGTALLVRLNARSIIGGLGGDYGGIAEFSLFDDGTAAMREKGTVGAPVTTALSGEWINVAPVEPADAALFEVYAEDIGGMGAAIDAAAGASLVGTTGAWLPMNADRIWTLTIDPATYDGPSTINPSETMATAILRVSIKRISAAYILETRNIALQIVIGPGGGGA